VLSDGLAVAAPDRVRRANRACVVAATALALTACTSAAVPAAKTPVTVVLTGDDPPLGGVRRALTAPLDLPVSLRLAALPNSGEEQVDASGPRIESSLADARKAYVDGQFTVCEHAIGPEDLVVDLLGRGKRAIAARLLFWGVACRVGAGTLADAATVAREFAALGLDLPPEVGVVAPEVEVTIAQAVREVAEKPKTSLRVTAGNMAAGHDPDVSVSIDGRATGCVTPCVLDAAPGDHVVGVEADGIVPEARRVRVDAGGAAVAFQTVRASPELAARQWSARYARSAAVDSSPSVRLLALAVRAPKLAFLAADGGRTARLRGVLAVDGAVDARVERLALERGDEERETPALLRELLVRGKVLEPAPRLYERAPFWIAVGVVAAGAVLGTYLVVHQPPGREQVTFQ
jgi:hypothetical protein